MNRKVWHNLLQMILMWRKVQISALTQRNSFPPLSIWIILIWLLCSSQLSRVGQEWTCFCFWSVTLFHLVWVCALSAPLHSSGWRMPPSFLFTCLKSLFDRPLTNSLLLIFVFSCPFISSNHDIYFENCSVVIYHASISYWKNVCAVFMWFTIWKKSKTCPLCPPLGGEQLQRTQNQKLQNLLKHWWQSSSETEKRWTNNAGSVCPL